MAKKHHKYVVATVLLLVALLAFYTLPKLNVADNLSDSLKEQRLFAHVKPFLEKGKRALVFSLQIENLNKDNYAIDSLGLVLAESLLNSFPKQIDTILYRSDIEPDEFADFVYHNLALYLNEADYVKIDSLLQPTSLQSTLQKNKELLAGNLGFGASAFIARDPLHLLPMALANMQGSVDVASLVQNEGLYITADGNHLQLNTSLRIDPSNVSEIRDLANGLADFQRQWNLNNPDNALDFFGTFLIVESNATQIKKDIILTVNLALIFITALLLYYYRNPLTILLFIIPGSLGILLALCAMYFIQGEISGLALSASAVVLGIVVDYSFHYFSHFSQESDPFKARNQIANPLLIGSITTIIAFYALTFAQAKALQDFGLFTSLSLVFTLIAILLFVPMLIKVLGKRAVVTSTTHMSWLINRLNSVEKTKARPVFVVLFFTLFVFLAFQAKNVGFETDLNKLNYYPDWLKQRELKLQNINPDTEKRITIVASGESPETAVASNRNLFFAMKGLAATGSAHQVGSIGGIILPEAEVAKKVQMWNVFWQPKAQNFMHDFNMACAKVGLQPAGFSEFLNLVSESPQPYNTLEFAQSYKSLRNLIATGTETNIISTLTVNKLAYESVKTELSTLNHVHILDGHSVATSLTAAIQRDFNLLLLIASITVFIVMLVVYGRIELTLISFLPMAISWIMILGLAALLDIKLNFINIMIATVIFGLGDDFAIFITDGLQSRYKYGTSILATHKAGILLSAITTVIGTGVLIFGQHPALRSIALISAIGIVTISVVSFVIQPWLYRFFILNRSEKGKPPYTLGDIILSVLAFAFFFIGSLVISIGMAITILLPLKKAHKKFVVHKLIQWFTGALINGMFRIKKRYFNLDKLDYSRPSIIIANHSSFLDILIMAMRNPRMVILVGDWVYHSLIFGWFIRFADYIPAAIPLEQNLEKVDQLMKSGYSVLVFPESHRSEDGKIRRFHKGAFFLAEKLQADISPVLIHGVNYTLPKDEYYVKSNFINLKVLPRITYNNPQFGSDYSTRGKNIARYFKVEFAKFSNERENADYYNYHLQYAYLYKGPVLEWYFRIKFKFEKHIYEMVDTLIDNRTAIADLGCGYGFLSYYLALRNANRSIVSLDYDDDKIAIATNAYLKNAQITFRAADIRAANLPACEAIILSDVLHYLQPAEQLAVLDNCAEILATNGIIIIKDALTDNAIKHAWTLRSERWSTRWLRFNKTTAELSFFNFEFIRTWASKNGLTAKVVHEAEKSSNVLLVLWKGAS